MRVRGKAALTLDTAVEIIAAVTDEKIIADSMSISNNSATATEVILLDGATEIGRFPAPAGGGAAYINLSAILTVSTALNAKLTIAATSVNIYVTGTRGK